MKRTLEGGEQVAVEVYVEWLPVLIFPGSCQVPRPRLPETSPPPSHRQNFGQERRREGRKKKKKGHQI